MKSAIFVTLILAVCTSLAAANPVPVLSAQDLPATRSADFRIEFDVDYEYRHAGLNRLIETGTIRNGIDLTRVWFDRPPFARLQFRGESESGFGAIAEASLRDQWTGDYFRQDNLPVVGVAGDAVRFENFFLSKAAVWYRGEGFEALLGREKPDYNGILRGGILPGTRLPYLDAIRAAGRIGRLKIDWMVASIPAIKSWDGNDVNPNAGVLPSGANYYGFDAEAFSQNGSPTAIIEAMNRLTWDLGRLRLGLTDHAMIARRNNLFYITDIIPVISRHQAGMSQTNNSLVLDAAWEPIDDLRLAVQAGFDDINAGIFGYDDTAAPTIDAYVAGLDYRKSASFVTLHTRLEAGYTHWLWGNYDGSQIWPNDVNPFLRFQYRYLADAGGLLLPLNSPYGPGARWGRLSVTADSGPLGFVVGLDTLILEKNDEANLIATPLNGNTTTASARTTWYWTLSMPVSWTMGMWRVSARPGVAMIDDEAWFELTLGAAMRFRHHSSPGDL